MLKLREILLYNYPYYIFLTIALLSFAVRTVFIKYESKYDINNNKISGKLIKYDIDGDKLSLVLKAKEKVQCIYYFSSLNEKTYYQNNLKLGIILNLNGVLEAPINNTIPNTFNYKKYLYNHQIYYVMKVDKIDVLNNKENIFYLLKNKLINKMNGYKGTTRYLKAFILGDISEINSEVYKDYQMLGISHLLAISGMNITLFATIILYILKKLKIPEDTRYIITIIFLFFHLFIAAFAPSVLRATLFFLFLTINKIFYTNIKTINIYIFTLGVLIIINPFILYDIGAEYSLVTSLGLILASEKLNDKNYFINLLKTSFIALLFSLGISGANFYELNILSLINNLIFVPLVSFIVYPLSLIVLIIPFLNPILNISINILEFLSTFMSNFSLSFLIPKTSLFFWLFYYLVLIIYVKSNKKIYLGLLIILLLGNYLIPKINSNNYIYFLDVGQGDSALIITSNQKEVIMIDTGGKLEYEKEAWQKRDSSYHISDNTIIFLKSLGINKLDLLVLSHGDYDHMGEAINLVENFKVEKVIFNCGEFNDLENELIKVLDKKKIPYYSCIKELNIDNNKLYFLNNKDYGNENDNSSVIYTELNNHKFLFMGDAGIEVEQDLIEKYNLKDIDVLKVGHHGSKTSSSEEFIDEINLKYSIISVGKNNRYGHPNDSVLDNLEDSKIYRTDQDGNIMFKIKNNKLEIETCPP